MGISLARAGLTTVPVVLTITAFHLLLEPSEMESLREEVTAVFPNPAQPPLLQLEQPLATTVAIVEGNFSFSHNLEIFVTLLTIEALRLSCGSVQLSPRVGYTTLI